MKRIIGFICVFLILLALLIYLFFSFKLGNKLPDAKVFNYITSITAIIGVIGLIYQQSRGHELNSSQYLTNLSHKYSQERSFQVLLTKLEDGTKSLDKNDLEIASRCLDFFEPFYLLQKANTFAMNQMDDLFCFRFFALVNNKQVQENVILKHCEYYANIGKLYKKWRRYRVRVWRKKPIPLVENDLKNRNWFNNLCAGKPVEKKTDSTDTNSEADKEEHKNGKEQADNVPPKEKNNVYRRQKKGIRRSCLQRKRSTICLWLKRVK